MSSYTNVKVVASALKTDHRAIIATDGGTINHQPQQAPVRIAYLRRTPTQYTTLLASLSETNFNSIYASDDPQTAWDLFYAEARSSLRQVTITSSADPSFTTPEIKYLLRRKNRLMRAGRVEEASAFADRVRKCIQRVTGAQLRDLDLRGDPKDLWTRVNNITKGEGHAVPDNAPTAEQFNEHFARLSTDDQYEQPSKRLTASPEWQFTSERQVFNLLDHLHHTADEDDCLPAWFLRLSAPVYSAPLAHLINLSFSTGHVPSQWKIAINHPIPKVDGPSKPADYRPISVVPVLSRTVERVLVHHYLYPSFLIPPMSDLFADQFPFRPTGSTTAAVIGISHHINEILAVDDYAIIISLDFAKAFDTVRHSALAQKLSSLELPDSIYNWLVEFLQDRTHSILFAGRRSPVASINASIIQGSILGPSEYVVSASDLHPVHGQNRIAKFADDTYLIIPSSMRHTTDEELGSVRKWAIANNLKLNASKSKEMIVARRLAPSARPPPLQDIERVTEMLILGVILRGDHRASSHVHRVLSLCNGSLHALRVLRWHGLSAEALSTVTEATIISRLLYASPA